MQSLLTENILPKYCERVQESSY
uniref:Uncharacterized protein n=1 Tax=Rhizophora mucronata TaxID=61149 RepID=A0A2P2R4C2_RHIMU